jgi:hypothetical protein
MQLKNSSTPLTTKGSANIIVFIVLLVTLGGAVVYFKSFPLRIPTPTEQPQVLNMEKSTTSVPRTVENIVSTNSVPEIPEKATSCLQDTDCILVPIIEKPETKADGPLVEENIDVGKCDPRRWSDAMMFVDENNPDMCRLQDSVSSHALRACYVPRTLKIIRWSEIIKKSNNYCKLEFYDTGGM